jgi:hypothetical protein
MKIHVPLTSVNVPLTSVNAPLTSVNVPLTSANVPLIKDEIKPKEVSPKVEQQPLLTLYDLFGVSEEERKQLNKPPKRKKKPVTRQRKPVQLNLFSQPAGNNADSVKPHNNNPANPAPAYTELAALDRKIQLSLKPVDQNEEQTEDKSHKNNAQNDSSRLNPNDVVAQTHPIPERLQQAKEVMGDRLVIGSIPKYHNENHSKKFKL